MNSIFNNLIANENYNCNNLFTRWIHNYPIISCRWIVASSESNRNKLESKI
jgi:hypothetical protein